jgi:hypothetical protein
MRTSIVLPLILAFVALGIACTDDNDNGNGYPHTTCEEVCPAMVAEGCDEGPATLEECMNDCTTGLAGDCASELQAMADCFMATGMTCEDSDIVGLDCQAEQGAWDTCSGTT